MARGAPKIAPRAWPVVFFSNGGADWFPAANSSRDHVVHRDDAAGERVSAKFADGHILDYGGSWIGPR